MKITDIKKQMKREGRFSVFVDEKYSFSLDSNGLLDNKVKIGKEVSEFDIEELKKASGDSILLARAYDKCMRRPHSEREIRDYLYKNKAEPDQMDQIIEKCKQNKLLDDSYFAERWVEYRRGQGRSTSRIKQELVQKGVNSSTVSQALAEESGDNNQALRQMIVKKRRTYSDDNKLIAYLQRQGFGYYDIVEQIKEIKQELEDLI